MNTASMVSVALRASRWLAPAVAVALGTPAQAAPDNSAGVATVATNAAAAGTMIAAAGSEAIADQQFRALFTTWKSFDKPAVSSAIAIPSVQPVQHLAFTSNFGVRRDPFQGTARMHAGVDIPGPSGTAVYATADGTVDRAERAGGYGNLVELDHGKGIQTRYGHLSKILVAPGTHVKRGDLIALMGSTGRSTGPHLHYEVRIDGKAVNPAPFLTSTDYLMAASAPGVTMIPVSSGPPPQD